MGYQLGIDLGTTYTAAAVCRSSDLRPHVEPEVVTLGTRNATVPSVLFVAPDGSVLVGEAAERRALTDPARVVREFKRRIGDPTPVVVGGREWSPEELSARLVRWVVDRVAEREGGPALRIAVTHPASWGSHKRELLGAAMAAQGVTATFLAEPQAAALHYAAAERIEAGATIAVYDLGGGTFDAAVVRKADPASGAPGVAGFGLLGRPEGLERLGGVDFDEVVFDHVREGLPAAFQELDDADPAVLSAVSRVRRECTEAKEALSSDTEVSIPVLMPASRGSVRLHRSEFESLIRTQVEETVDALRKAVSSAGLTPEQLTAVLLVGGSSRIPLVSQLVSEQLGRPVAVDADPKNAIAKGAALAVSPKPASSWPAVAIPPLAAPVGGATGGARSAGPAVLGAGAVGGALAASAGAAALASGPRPMPAPPARPPRQPLPTPSNGMVRSAAPPPPPPRDVAPTAAFTPDQRTSVLPPPRTPHPAPAGDWDYDREPEPRRRPIGVLVGIGGLLVVAAVVVGVVLIARSGSEVDVRPATGSDTSSDVTGVVPADTTTAPADSGPGGSPGEAPRADRPSTGSRPGTGGSPSAPAPDGGAPATPDAATTTAPAVPPSGEPIPPEPSAPPAPSVPPAVPPAAGGTDNSTVPAAVPGPEAGAGATPPIGTAIAGSSPNVAPARSSV